MRNRQNKLINRIKRKGSLICLTLIMMLSTQVAGAESVPSDMNDIPEVPGMSLDYAKNGIVRIQAGTINDAGKFKIKTTCSGFIASDVTGSVYIVTTMHSVDYGKDRHVRVVVKNDTTVEANVQSENREKDFCILAVENKFNDKNEVPLRVPSYDDEKDVLSAGAEVSALGFTKTGSSVEYSAADVNAQSGRLVKTADENSGYIAHDIEINKEMDGGVLVDKDGYAIGLLNTKAGGALDITEVDTLLDKENMLHRTKDKDLMYGELYDLCADAKALYKRSKGDSREELVRVRDNALDVLHTGPFMRDALSTALSDYNEMVENADLKTPKGLIIVIALGAVILFLAYRLWRLKKWNKAHSLTVAVENAGHIPGKPAPVPAFAPKKAGKAPVSNRRKSSSIPQAAQLVMLKSGETYTIGTGRFTIGRSDDSDLVISGNNRVGRNHAFIERRPEAFYLFDMGSKNGTFINNMRADADGIRLISGDIIRLADEEIQFIQK